MTTVGGQIADFGVLGLWTGVLLYEKFKIEAERQRSFKEFAYAMSQNTEILKVLERTIDTAFQKKR